MSNSRLVDYVKISPNRTRNRTKKIDRITIHHMAGDLSVETCGNVFAPVKRRASSNYGIDSTGRVGMYVEEKDRAWTSSSSANDQRAVTIEVADNAKAPNWGCSDKAMSKLILLCADICRRNGIKSLRYTGNTNGNLTLHKWFASTDCPGAFLENNMRVIASEVNKLLTSGATTYSWSKKSTNTKNLLELDGFFGEKTVRASQRFLKTTVDGIVSNQPTVNKKYLCNSVNHVWIFKDYRYCYNGSEMVRALQKFVGTVVDGFMGKQTITALQKFLKINADGYMGAQTVKAWQSYLNKHSEV